MKESTWFICLVLCIPGSSPATSPPAFAGECAVVGQAAAVAALRTSQGRIGLEALENVAAGKAHSVSTGAEVRIGLSPGVLHGKDFLEPAVRACALRSLGEIGSPEATEFLSEFKPPPAAEDPGQLIWPAAQIALGEARLRNIGDTQSKIVFLERTLTEPHDAVSNSALTHWAVNQLCDRGALVSLSAIQQSIRNRGNGARDEAEITFCEERIRVVRRDPDPVKALRSVLKTEVNSNNLRIIEWAVAQLAKIGSPAADAELDRFASEIAKLPENSSAQLFLSRFRQEIANLQAARSPSSLRHQQ
jgi:hypothetical protein